MVASWRSDADGHHDGGQQALWTRLAAFRLVLVIRIGHAAEQIAARSRKPDLHRLQWINRLPL
jgi:hypothetical protein